MTLHLRRWRRPQLGVVVAMVLLPSLGSAADHGSRAPKFGEFNPDHQTVEMFSAIDKGDIEVKLIPKDSTQCRVMIENKTQQPLNIKLPEAFAGVPVLAQPGIGGAGIGGAGGRNFGGGQGFGGGMGFGGMGMGGMGMGMMNVPPEKVGKLEVTTVCLEHGKDEPRPNMPYEIKPIAEFTDKAEVHELCRMLGTGQIDQRAAQVAAWHLNNDMSFEELAAKELRRANGMSRPYFSPMEIRVGMKISAMATVMAEQRKRSPGEDSSLSLK